MNEKWNEMNENEIIKNFLTEIISNIEMIDGGCPDCIGSFCRNTNYELEKYNLKLVYSEEYPITVSIESL